MLAASVSALRSRLKLCAVARLVPCHENEVPSMNDIWRALLGGPSTSPLGATIGGYACAQSQ